MDVLICYACRARCSLSLCCYASCSIVDSHGSPLLIPYVSFVPDQLAVTTWIGMCGAVRCNSTMCGQGSLAYSLKLGWQLV